MPSLKISLPLKFFLATATAIVVTALWITWFMMAKQVALVRTSLENRCDSLARNLATDSAYGVLTANKQNLQRLADATTREEHVAYSLIFDRGGRLLAASEAPDLKGISGEIYAFADYRMPLTNGGSSRSALGSTYVSLGGIPIKDTTVPVITKRGGAKREEIALMDTLPETTEIRGFVHVGVSVAPLHREINGIKRGVLLLTVLVTLAALVLSYLLVHVITRPLRELAIGTRQIAQGDLDYRVPVTTKDEIGEVAVLFNQMTSILKDNREALRKEKEDLLHVKAILEDRTNQLEATLEKVKSIQHELFRAEKFATMGRLAASIAHELRNPLASLKNISYYLMKTGTFADDKSRMMMQQFSVDVARANKIVTDLLDFSGSRKITRSMVRADELVQRLLEKIDFSRLHLTVQLEPVEAMIDPDKISQALGNLLMNARENTPEGGTVTVTARARDAFLEIIVSDTGYGMDRETLDHLFEPLFSTKVRGLGLSLAIVKDIVAQHYGHIAVESEKGKGTAFTVHLPLQQEGVH